METPENKGDAAALEAYRTTRDTRNFEIRLFWQRSNYFLVLNTALGTGFFALLNHGEFALLLGGLGVISSWLWLLVNLGSKFWQSRWEQQLEDEEAKLGARSQELFSASRPMLIEIVERSLDRDYRKWRLDRRVWYWGVLKKPSVSLMMTWLSCAFIIFWLVAIAGLLVRDYLR